MGKKIRRKIKQKRLINGKFYNLKNNLIEIIEK